MNSKKNKVDQPNLLLVCGAGRKVGKTTLLCFIIKRFCEKIPIAAIKISPHFHPSEHSILLAEDPKKFRIFQESSEGQKDSNKYIRFGARMSLFVETGNQYVLEAFTAATKEFIPGFYNIVCESGALLQEVNPGVSIFVDRNTDSPQSSNKSGLLEKCTISTKMHHEKGMASFTEIIDSLSVDESGWKIGESGAASLSNELSV